MNHDVRFQRDSRSTFSRFAVVVTGVFLLMGWPTMSAAAAVGPGAAALLAPDVETKLNLSSEQRQQIQAIVRATAKKYSEVQSGKAGSPGARAELDRIRQAGQDEAVALLTPAQKRTWSELAARN